MNNQTFTHILDEESSNSQLRIWKTNMQKKVNPVVHERLSTPKLALTKADLNLKLLKADIRISEHLIQKLAKAHVEPSPVRRNDYLIRK